MSSERVWYLSMAGHSDPNASYWHDLRALTFLLRWVFAPDEGGVGCLSFLRGRRVFFVKGTTIS